MNENNKWYSNILNQICKALNSFIAIFKKHGTIYTILIMVLFIIFYSAIINPIRVGDIIQSKLTTEIQKVKDEEQTKQQLSMERRLEANNIISDIMQKLVDKFPNIHRVMMLEAHNSLQSLQGVDFLYYSCSYEALTPNSREFIYLSDDLQRQMRVNLIGNNMINTLKHRSYIYYPEIKKCRHTDHRLIHKLAQYDDECIIIPFLNEKDDPVILLVISGDEMPVNDIFEYVNEFRKQIDNCLM